MLAKKIISETSATISSTKTVGGSWSMLKNAAMTSSSVVPSLSTANLGAEFVGGGGASDSFLKYKMQLLEKEKMLREQESMKKAAQREKDNLK